ncbi:hypothetical protein OHB04_02455 [Streptomyces sp. NBC_01775]|uniref:hypothetical protein n=1 Tax=Streptomyces sp. NBC_01775 TaxID=2975939 RepID=UPI002DD7ED16|nr:hypothetical protein [Streptomyces sp. NBC_01775]WSB74755.1 hypothetical protein OHB04_02455 [Streptomyces sp. NBC_01775]
MKEIDMHEFNPPRYTWTATTAREADNVLQAVQDLIAAHLATLVPRGGGEKLQTAKTAPVTLTVSLDLSGLIEQINTQRAAAGLAVSLGDGA